MTTLPRRLGLRQLCKALQPVISDCDASPMLLNSADTWKKFGFFRVGNSTDTV